MFGLVAVGNLEMAGPHTTGGWAADDEGESA